jgi:hypothetical protein
MSVTQLSPAVAQNLQAHLRPASPDAIPLTVAKPMTAAEMLARVRDRPASPAAVGAVPAAMDPWKAFQKEWGKVAEAAGSNPAVQWVGVVVGAADLAQQLRDPKATTLDHAVVSMDLLAKVAEPTGVELPPSVRLVFDLTKLARTLQKPEADVIKVFFQGTKVATHLAVAFGGVIPPQVGLILTIAEKAYECVGDALKQAS